MKGVVTERIADCLHETKCVCAMTDTVGVIRGEDGHDYTFARGCLLRNFTTSANTRIGDTVYFEPGGRAIDGYFGEARWVSWKPVAPARPVDETLRIIVEQGVKNLADAVDKDVLERAIGNLQDSFTRKVVPLDEFKARSEAKYPKPVEAKP